MVNSNKKIDFESSLKELESIVTKLEDENINLEDSVKSFEAPAGALRRLLRAPDGTRGPETHHPAQAWLHR